MLNMLSLLCYPCQNLIFFPILICLLDRYLMQFQQIIYIIYIYVNDFGAPSHTHNFNTSINLSWILAPPKNRFRLHEKSLQIARKYRFGQWISLHNPWKLLQIADYTSDRTKSRFRQPISPRIEKYALYRMNISKNAI